MKKIIMVSKIWEDRALLEAYKVGESSKKEFIDHDDLLRNAFASTEDSKLYGGCNKRFKNVEAFLDEVAEKNLETGKYGHFKFPNDQWFEAVLGGKWQGQLLVKRPAMSMSGFRSEFTAPSYCPRGYAWVDSAMVKDIAFSLMDALVKAANLDKLSVKGDIYTDDYKEEFIQSNQSLFADVLLDETGWKKERKSYTEYIKSLPPETIISIYECR